MCSLAGSSRLFTPHGVVSGLVVSLVHVQPASCSSFSNNIGSHEWFRDHEPPREIGHEPYWD